MQERKVTMKTLSVSKYILTDDVLPEYFIKKQGQMHLSWQVSFLLVLF